MKEKITILLITVFSVSGIKAIPKDSVIYSFKAGVISPYCFKERFITRQNQNTTQFTHRRLILVFQLVWMLPERIFHVNYHLTTLVSGGFPNIKSTIHLLF